MRGYAGAMQGYAGVVRGYAGAMRGYAGGYAVPCGAMRAGENFVPLCCLQWDKSFFARASRGFARNISRG